MKEKSGMRWIKLLSVAALLAGCETQVQEIEQLAEATVRGSVGTNDLQSGGESYNASLSADGRFVAFECTATNLVTLWNNGKRQIYVRDRRTDTVEMVSVDNSGLAGNDNSYNPSISADGRYVAFESRAGNLDKGSHSTIQVFLRDRSQRRTEAVSTINAGDTWPSLDSTNPSVTSSSDSILVAFQTSMRIFGFPYSEAPNTQQVVVWTRPTSSSTASLTLASHYSGSSTAGTGDSKAPVLSSDGRFVAFSSSADLMAASGTATEQVYVWTRQDNTLAVASVVSGVSGTKGTSNSNNAWISDDGRFVVFATLAPNLLGADPGGKYNIVRRDRILNLTEVVSVGLPGSPGLFTADCRTPVVSADGRIIVFEAGDIDTTLQQIYVRDMAGGARMISVDSFGRQAALPSRAPALSSDGTVAAWDSDSSNLVLNDTNLLADVFLRFPLR